MVCFHPHIHVAGEAVALEAFVNAVVVVVVVVVVIVVFFLRKGKFASYQVAFYCSHSYV